MRLKGLKEKNKNNSINTLLASGKPYKNQAKKNGTIIAVVVVTMLLIGWVYTLGKKAENTVPVAMVNQAVYKNQVITQEMLSPYEMLIGEFEKYSVADSNGQMKRRVVLWEEAGQLIGSFAAYPIQKDTYAEYRSFIKSRVDNSDSVLYSFPGKEIVPLEIGAEELQAFKTFLQPGDRLNIEATFSDKETITSDDGFGGVNRTDVEVFVTENVFKDIMIADLLNQGGESILDIYAAYRDKDVYEQAQMDLSQSFKESTTPSKLLVALTPEEKERYYYYISKNQVTFRVSMPQRVE